MADAADTTTVQDHLNRFHDVDFEGFMKGDWGLFGRLHTHDVLVEINGQKTEGRAPHIDVSKMIYAAVPEGAELEHSLEFGQGEWTCVFGRTKATADRPAGAKMVTVARWRGGQICEEYIWGG